MKYEAKIREEVLHEYSNSNIGKSIQEIVDDSDNEVWKANLAGITEEGDYLSRDIKYHKGCHTSHWQYYVKRPKMLSTDDNDGDVY